MMFSMKGTRRIFAAFIFASGAVSALAQVNPPPWWGTNDGFTTSQSWTFDTPALGLPEYSLNPFGPPNAVSNGNYVPVMGNRQGLWDLRDGQLMDFFIPNQPNREMYKECWWQLNYFGGGTPFSIFTSAGSTVANFNSVSIDVDPDDFMITWTATFTINPQPEWERIVFGTDVGSPNGITIDSFHFGTHCVPEPASLAAIATGLAGAALRRRRR